MIVAVYDVKKCYEFLNLKHAVGAKVNIITLIRQFRDCDFSTLKIEREARRNGRKNWNCIEINARNESASSITVFVLCFLWIYYNNICNYVCTRTSIT